MELNHYLPLKGYSSIKLMCLFTIFWFCGVFSKFSYTFLIYCCCYYLKKKGDVGDWLFSYSLLLILLSLNSKDISLTLLLKSYK